MLVWIPYAEEHLKHLNPYKIRHCIQCEPALDKRVRGKVMLRFLADHKNDRLHVDSFSIIDVLHQPSCMEHCATTTQYMIEKNLTDKEWSIQCEPIHIDKGECVSVLTYTQRSVW